MIFREKSIPFIWFKNGYVRTQYSNRIGFDATFKLKKKLLMMEQVFLMFMLKRKPNNSCNIFLIFLSENIC